MTHDDPRLTTYALGELDALTADDLAEIEALLATDETARQAVEETRRAAASLKADLALGEALPALTTAQRQTIAAAATPTGAPARTLKLPSRRAAWVRWSLATAACAALAGAVAWNVFNAPDKPVAHKGKNDPATTPAVAPVGPTAAPTTRPNLSVFQNSVTFDQNNHFGTNAVAPRGVDPSTASTSTTLNWHDHQQLGLQRGQQTTAGPTAVNGTVWVGGTFFAGQPTSGTNTAGVAGMGGPGIGAGGAPGAVANSGLSLDGVNTYTGRVAVTGGTLVNGGVLAGTGTAPAGLTGNAPAGGPGDRRYRHFDIGGEGTVIVGKSIATKDASGTIILTDGTKYDPQGNASGYALGVPTTPAVPPVTPLPAVTSTPKVPEPTVLATGVDLKKVADNPVTKTTAEAKGIKLAQDEREGVDRFAKLAAKPGEVPAPVTGEALVKQRKDFFAYSFNDQLGRAQDAVARGERELAIAEITRAKAAVHANLATLAVDELSEVNARLAQVETALNNNESYARLNDNPFKAVAGDPKAEPLSTFSIDVDTASYSNVRRFLDAGQLPPPDAVRIEELLNYFPYSYEQPAKDAKEPFKAVVEVAGCPWNANHRLARVAIKGKEIAHDKRPVSNLVFLIDVSGSMNEPKKLPLVKQGLQMMVKELTENDRVAIVVYAGAAGLVLPSTCADPMGKEKIRAAIENLSAGGSTNGAHGIQLAYNIASEHYIKGGTNRVILATDGDWNVGITDKTSLDNLIVDKAKSGVFLSALGFGYGNLKDSTLESISNKGNGHYAYIDDQKEARKVLVEEMSGTLVTIAKDVKIQVEFNPAKVQSYRLIGYENRMLRAQDFNNDKIDAGEIGAGHCVTALYEIVPIDPNKNANPGPATFGVIVDVAGAAAAAAKPAGIDPLIYADRKSDDLLTLKLRYKAPEGDTSTKLTFPAKDAGASYAKASDDFKFAAAVAQFGMILRNSPHKGSATFAGVIELADEGKGKDEKGYRKDFVELAKKAKAISRQP
ncbi:MAG TPA: VWA domain-containing protein [Tepidisphaeraceae bacterium]|nr:VWA domain-containing protein [Tepidisphaeraceae bacterium]